MHRIFPFNNLTVGRRALYYERVTETSLMVLSFPQITLGRVLPHLSLLLSSPGLLPLPEGTLFLRSHESLPAVDNGGSHWLAVVA